MTSSVVLVTGASGFVGTAVVRMLLLHGRVVRVLVRKGCDRRNLVGLPIELAFGDLTDPASLTEAVRGCTSVVHAAADYRLWVRDPVAMHRVNIDGTVALMRAALAHGVERVVYTSSVATLGHAADGSAADETAPSALADMVGAYKRSKFLAEAAVRALVAAEGLPAVIVNPSAPLGPRDLRPTPTGRLIAQAVAGRMPAYVDTGLNVVHVDDVALGHVLALQRGRVGERYILGGDNLTLAEILDSVARLTGAPPPRFKLPRAAVYPVAAAAEIWGRLSGREPFVTLDGLRMARHQMFYSSAKAERELGYSHRPAALALADAVAWFRRGDAA